MNARSSKSVNHGDDDPGLRSVAECLAVPYTLVEDEHGSGFRADYPWCPGDWLPAGCEPFEMPSADRIEELESMLDSDVVEARRRRAALHACAASAELKCLRAVQRYAVGVYDSLPEINLRGSREEVLCQLEEAGEADAEGEVKHVERARAPHRRRARRLEWLSTNDYLKRIGAHVRRLRVLVTEFDGPDQSDTLSRAYERLEPIRAAIGRWGSDLEERARAAALRNGDRDWPGIDAAAAVLAHSLNSIAERYGEAQTRPPTHSLDFTSASWFGVRFHFTKTQAVVVGALWDEWKKGGLGLSNETIASLLDSEASRFRVQHVFRNSGNRHPAWGTMIQPSGKGTYRLVEPA